MTLGPATTMISAYELEACPSSRVVGFIPTGMIDWPGKVASTLFLAGCPMRCPYCHNPDLLDAQPVPDSWAGLLSHLSLRRGWLDGVVVTGGEPTAAPDLIDILEIFAARGIPVKLDTNGTSPQLLGHVLEAGLVEYVALDIKTLPDRYDRIGPPDADEAFLASIEIVLASGVAHEFRTTVYPPLIATAELPELAKLVAGGDLYVLQQFRPERTLDPAAVSVTPASPEEITSAAAACTSYLPTTTRGV
ncbi:MAG: anaerobic ribonucleoside-triphosphate reductase activating protein [Coriobacteriia bacterium]|nr:anaerobic ribonucleoside-triphosphate reductase activating protein [Coriobacteriia bacterium]